MKELTRGLSFVRYEYEGGPLRFTVPFPYIASEHIRAAVGDPDSARAVPVKWINGDTIEIPAQDGMLSAPYAVTLKRVTPVHKLLVDFKEGANLPARDLRKALSQLLYLQQEGTDAVNHGGSGSPGGGTGGSGFEDIQTIIDQVMQSPIMGLLTERLASIDETAETLLQEILRSDKVYGYRHEDRARVALVETKVTTLQNDQQSMAERVDDVYVKFDGQEAQIHSVQKAVADAHEANAIVFEGINARMGENESDIKSVRQSVVDETSARTTAMQVAKSEWQDADNAVTQAFNLTLTTTYATKDYAQATAKTQVEALANGKFANLEQRFEALVDGTADPDGGWQANYTVRINAGQIDGTPVIAGIGLGVDSKTGSNFVVMADRFAFVSPTYTTSGGVQQMKYPFVIGTVGGVSTVGITGQLLVDGTITADKLRVNSLSALSANMGEVNGGTFRTYTLDAFGNVADPNEFRVEVTNIGTWPLWIGSGVKNENNAVMWVDRNGRAKFAGEVSAPNITSQLQRTTTVQWAGPGTTNGATSPFTLAAPVRVGETHVAVMTFSVALKNTYNNIKQGANLNIDYLVGGIWTSLSSQWFWLGGADESSYSLSAISPPLSASTQFRVRISGGYPDQAVYMNAVTGYILGVR